MNTDSSITRALRPPRRWFFNGDQLRAKRVAQGLSYARLAQLLASVGMDVNHETIRGWEVGRAEPRASQLFTVARALQLSPVQLMLDGRKPGKTPARKPGKTRRK